MEKASKSVEEPQILKSPVSIIQKTSLTQSFDQRITSHSLGTQSNISEEAPVKQSRVKVTTRWPFNEENENTKSIPKVGQSVNQSRGIHSRDSSSDHTHSHSRGSSIDVRIYFISSRKHQFKNWPQGSKDQLPTGF